MIKLLLQITQVDNGYIIQDMKKSVEYFGPTGQRVTGGVNVATNIGQLTALVEKMAREENELAKAAVKK